MAKKTALYNKHLEYGGKIVDYAGWNLSSDFEGLGLVAEHNAVRNDVGVFDVSHMGEIEIKGPEAAKYVQYLCTNDIDSITDNQVIYTFFCQEDGGIVEDLLVYKYNTEHYLLVVNGANVEKDVEWVNKHKEGFDVEVIDSSPEISEVAVQGPKAQATVQKLVDFDLDEIKFFHFKDNVSVGGVNCLISRTGYTGEDGFEIYFKNEDAEKVWDLVFEAGEEFNIKPAGLGCRDTLRFEANLPLYGNELTDSNTPLEAGYGFFVKTGIDADFIGKDVLKKQKEEGLKRKVVGFEMIDKGIPRHGYKVEVDGKEIGYVTTGYSAPTVGKTIGMAMVDIEYAEIGTEIEIAIRKKKAKAKVISRKFLERHNKSK
ncbi:MAG: glycine cleavage system aminomethyltransferase GcvT [Andreesenia angusta]|nr:glycine cleavage system aminomethyltransferase GcvT [Andreesenia angusta]